VGQPGAARCSVHSTSERATALLQEGKLLYLLQSTERGLAMLGFELGN
jgi:hypothetical protein